MKMSKRKMAEKLGYEYLGKGFDDACDDGFLVRKIGTTNFISIGNTMAEAEDWLIDKINQLNIKNK